MMRLDVTPYRVAALATLLTTLVLVEMVGAVSLSDLPVVHDIHLWYEADTGVETATGVSRWANMADDSPATGDTKDLTQSTAAKQPQLLGAGLGGRPAVHFDGLQNVTNGDFLSTSATGLMEGLSGFETFIVSNVARQNDYGRILSEETGGVGNRVYTFVVNNQNKIYSTMDVQQTGGGGIVNRAITETTASTGTSRIYGHRLDANTMVLDVNGVQVAASSNDIDSTVTGKGSVLGVGQVASQSAGNPDGTRMDVAEIIVYNNSLTPAERNSVGYYLEEKYGLSTSFLNPDVKAMSGKTLWLDAETLSGADGSAVSAWTDSSGQGNNALQSDTTCQPTLQLNEINGRPVVRFDGSECMTIDSFTNGGDATMFVAFRANALGNAQLFNTNGSEVDAGNYIFQVTPDGKFRARVYQGSNSGLVDGPIGAHQLCVGSYVFDSGNQAELFMNGVYQGFASAATISSGAATASLGSHPSPTAFFDGDIAELLIFDRQLLPSERATVEAYLLTKYSIPEPSTLVLGAIGALAMLVVRIRRRKRA